METKSLRRACQQFFSSSSTREQKLDSFKRLLESDSVIAQGIAFDQFFYVESLTRFGSSNPYWQYSEQLLRKAREQLKNPPVTVDKSKEKAIVGANHASALGVLAHLGQERDISLIEPILRSACDSSVLDMGFGAAEQCLRDTENPYPEIIAALSQIIFAEERDLDIRAAAIRAFSGYMVPEVEEVLVKATKQCPLPVSAHAAWLLSARNFQKHLALLEEISKAWPDDAMYPASEICELIKSSYQSQT
ncbi:hypothetical protein IC235_00070 [Hymenobacter sp. BT664]|uniref:HEAT repeat domain-containing protein n=1 Tax=Hymenobacter montanus TaxID=2771359 RepID=A0A927GHG2_9BACT|nr:hypothetical protein [Hymenobacter montanus]